MHPVRRFIENHFSFVLGLSSLAGLVVPGLPNLPNESAVLILALLMFVACYRLRDGGFTTISWRDIGLFCLLRYGVLPVALWAVAYLLVPSYATAILLLTTVPSAVSAPALTAIYNGTVPMAFAIAIVSQLATPFLVPLQFTWLAHFGLAPAGQIIPAPSHLFMTMVWCIFVPMLAYALTRHHTRSADYIYDKGKLFAILLVSFVIALVIAKQRDVILSNVMHLTLSFGIALCCFGMYLLFGWLFSRSKSPAERITYTTCSGFNNVALSVSLALMHFGADVILFVAIAELGWSLLPVLLSRFLQRQPL